MNTLAAAKALQISKNTLLRWIAGGRIKDVKRDRNNWRIFTGKDLHRIKKEIAEARN